MQCNNDDDSGESNKLNLNQLLIMRRRKERKNNETMHNCEDSGKKRLLSQPRTNAHQIYILLPYYGTTFHIGTATKREYFEVKHGHMVVIYLYHPLSEAQAPPYKTVLRFCASMFVSPSPTTVKPLRVVRALVL